MSPGNPRRAAQFRFDTATGMLGVEVTKLLRPASSNGGILAAAAAAYHRQVVQIAQGQCCRVAGAKPARVSACERKYSIRTPLNRRVPIWI